MTDWTNFWGDLSNGVFIRTSTLQHIINNTSNIYERVMVLQSLKGGITPIGAIMLWKGSAASIPNGFQLADGTNGTPDLRGLFVMGIGATETDNNLLQTGGATTHTQDVGTMSNATKHSHTVYLNDSGAFVSAQSGGATQVAMAGHNHSWSAITSSEDEHTHTDSYEATNHLPPYTKYYWIVRIPA